MTASITYTQRDMKIQEDTFMAMEMMQVVPLLADNKHQASYLAMQWELQWRLLKESLSIAVVVVMGSLLPHQLACHQVLAAFSRALSVLTKLTMTLVSNGLVMPQVDQPRGGVLCATKTQGMNAANPLA